MNVFLSRLTVLFLGCTLAAPVALAQSAGLFPELNGARRNEPVVRREVSPAGSAALQGDLNSEPVLKNTQVQRSAIGTSSTNELFPDLKQKSVQPEEEEEDSDSKIRLIIDDIKSTIPPADNFAYCKLKMKLENNTRYKLNQLGLVLTFGEGKMRLIYNNVDKKGKTEKSLTMAGKVCHSLLTMPKIDVTTCSMIGLSEDSCKKKLEFVPIP